MEFYIRNHRKDTFPSVFYEAKDREHINKIFILHPTGNIQHLWLYSYLKHMTFSISFIVSLFLSTKEFSDL